MRVSTIAVACVLLVSGCTVGVPKENISKLSATDLATKVTIEGTKFDKAITYKSTPVDFDLLSYFLLRSWKFKDGPITQHQLYVHRYYSGDWVFYERAADDRAQSVDVTVIDRSVGSCSSYGCSHSEDVGVSIGHDYLLSRQDTGFEIRLTSRNGSGAIILKVPSNYIKGHLMAIGAI